MSYVSPSFRLYNVVSPSFRRYFNVAFRDSLPKKEMSNHMRTRCIDAIDCSAQEMGVATDRVTTIEEEQWTDPTALGQDGGSSWTTKPSNQPAKWTGIQVFYCIIAFETAMRQHNFAKQKLNRKG